MESVEGLVTVQLINLQLELIKNVTHTETVRLLWYFDDQTKTKFTNYKKNVAHIRI